MSAGRITANLPSRDFDVTEAFYHRLGFQTVYRGEGWMILEWRGLWVEFFPHPDLNPAESWFSTCLRLREIETVHAAWLKLDLPTDAPAFPRIGTEVLNFEDAPPMFFLHDPDGSLWRVMSGEAG